MVDNSLNTLVETIKQGELRSVYLPILPSQVAFTSIPAATSSFFLNNAVHCLCGGFSFVKEGRKNWEEEVSSEHNVVMGGTRQDGEL